MKNKLLLAKPISETGGGDELKITPTHMLYPELHGPYVGKTVGSRTNENLGQLDPDNFKCVCFNNGYLFLSNTYSAFDLSTSDFESKNTETTYFAIADGKNGLYVKYSPELGNDYLIGSLALQDKFKKATSERVPLPIYLSNTSPPQGLYNYSQSQIISGKYQLEIDLENVPCQYIRVKCVEPPSDKPWIEFSVEYKGQHEFEVNYELHNGAMVPGDSAVNYANQFLIYFDKSANGQIDGDENSEMFQTFNNLIMTGDEKSNGYVQLGIIGESKWYETYGTHTFSIFNDYAENLDMSVYRDCLITDRPITLVDGVRID